MYIPLNNTIHGCSGRGEGGGRGGGRGGVGLNTLALRGEVVSNWSVAFHDTRIGKLYRHGGLVV